MNATAEVLPCPPHFSSGTFSLSFTHKPQPTPYLTASKQGETAGIKFILINVNSLWQGPKSSISFILLYLFLILSTPAYHHLYWSLYQHFQFLISLYLHLFPGVPGKTLFNYSFIHLIDFFKMSILAFLCYVQIYQ
jgi:hypothetical protein